MRNLKFFVVLFALIGLGISFNACDENPPFIIDYGAGALSDTTYITTDIPAAQQKIVVIEEFTGVQCVNCPDGHIAMANIVDTYGDRIVPFSIHAGFLSDPYTESLQDFVTEQGQVLHDNFEIPAYPAAVVDRVQFAGESRISLLDFNAWATRVGEQLALSTPVNIDFPEITYDEATRVLTAFVQVTYTEALDATHNLSVVLAENHIVDVQLTPSGKNYEYEFEHVFRTMLTPVTGTDLGSDFEAGRVFIKSFGIIVPESWNAEELEVAAMVHDIETGVIIQGNRTYVSE